MEKKDNKKVTLRVWKEFDLEEIEKHLIVVGELSGECFSCRQLGVDVRQGRCPNCGTEFKYMGFRRKVNGKDIVRFKREYPQMIFIEFEDFKKNISRERAKKLLLRD